MERQPLLDLRIQIAKTVGIELQLIDINQGRLELDHFEGIAKPIVHKQVLAFGIVRHHEHKSDDLLQNSGHFLVVVALEFKQLGDRHFQERTGLRYQVHC